MVKMKDIQAKEKAHPKGTSKILAKARKKAMEDEKKGDQQPSAPVCRSKSCNLKARSKTILA